MSRCGPALILLVALAAAAGPPAWPEALPSLRLLDPLDTEFTDAQLTPRGVVLVVTAPTHAQGDAQKAWGNALATHAGSKTGPVVVMLEDMSQSWFRPIVIGRMKDAYRPAGSIVLLLDESGATRKALGVAENSTVAFAFAPGGKLVAVETGAASAERALRLLEAARRR